MKRSVAIACFLVAMSAVTSQAVEVEVNGKKVDVPFCGGFAGIQCSATEWCEFPAEHACGIADYPGRCESRPAFCPQVYIPVCGCDGKTHGNSCAASMAGSDVAYAGPCVERK